MLQGRSPRLQIKLAPMGHQVVAPPPGLGATTTISYNNQTLGLQADEMEVVCELGRGTYGDVTKMRDRKTGAVVAVKRIKYTMNTVEQQRTAMDLDVAMRSLDCPFTVHFYGAMFRDGDVWICMEVMDSCLDRLYRRLLLRGETVPEWLIARVAAAVVQALNFLHKQMKVIHRDVKPSNILLSTNGTIKLCDFGVSAFLIDSLAKTRDAGTGPYMAPERIDRDPDDNSGFSPVSYSVKADVWSLGISLLEVAQGSFPYPAWSTPFDQLRMVVEGPAPTPRQEFQFTARFTQFISLCLMKDAGARAGYTELLEHSFVTEREDNMDHGEFVRRALEECSSPLSSLTSVSSVSNDP